jgi:hypothetical protein
LQLELVGLALIVDRTEPGQFEVDKLVEEASVERGSAVEQVVVEQVADMIVEIGGFEENQEGRELADSADWEQSFDISEVEEEMLELIVERVYFVPLEPWIGFVGGLHLREPPESTHLDNGVEFVGVEFVEEVSGIDWVSAFAELEDFERPIEREEFAVQVAVSKLAARFAEEKEHQRFGSLDKGPLEGFPASGMNCPSSERECLWSCPPLRLLDSHDTADRFDHKKQYVHFLDNSHLNLPKWWAVHKEVGRTGYQDVQLLAERHND